MALANTTISTVSLTGAEGTTESAGVAYLTVTCDDGFHIKEGQLSIGGTSESVDEPNAFYGGNVTDGVEKVVFTYPQPYPAENATVDVAVHYNLFDWDSATDLYIDIDGKVHPNGEREDDDCCKRWDDHAQTGAFEPQVQHPTDGQANGKIIFQDLTQVKGCCSDSIQEHGSELGDVQVNVKYGDYGDWENAGMGWQTGDNAVTLYSANTTGIVDFLWAGHYTIEYIDRSCGQDGGCESKNYSVVLNGSQPTDNSINDFQFGESVLIEPEIHSQAQLRDVTITHGRNASFEFEAFDKGTGKWYDFESGDFTLGRTSVIVDEPGTRVTRYSMSFPSVSATARYEMFLTPLKNSIINTNKIPTNENRKLVYQRVDNTITLSLKSTNNSSNWGTFVTKTLTGRPNTKTKKVVKNQKIAGYTTSPEGAHDNVEFTITAAFSAGGGKSTVTVNKAPPKYLSSPKNKDFIVSYDSQEATADPNDGKEMYIANNVSVSSLSATYSSTTLTVTGRMSVEKFGSTSETFFIDIDNFVTLS